MSRVRSLVAAATFVLATIASTGLVSASTVAECTTGIQQLGASVAAADFTNAKDAASLAGKLTQAEQKLAAGKTDDAIAKLVDFGTRVEQLGAAGKLGAEDAATLIAGANASVACIQEIQPA